MRRSDRGVSGDVRRPDLELYHLYSRVEKIVDDDLMPPVGTPFEVTGENRVRLQERIEGNRHRVDIDWPLTCAPRPTKHASQRTFPRWAPASE